MADIAASANESLSSPQKRVYGINADATDISSDRATAAAAAAATGGGGNSSGNRAATRAKEQNVSRRRHPLVINIEVDIDPPPPDLENRRPRLGAGSGGGNPEVVGQLPSNSPVHLSIVPKKGTSAQGTLVIGTPPPSLWPENHLKPSDIQVPPPSNSGRF